MHEPGHASVTPSAKHQLVLTAERLFAQRGLSGVPLRLIGTEAGMANKSAVQYHFGSKDALVKAILLNRLEELTHRRQLLEARIAPEDGLRAVIEAHQLPLIELAEDKACYYLPFLEQLLRYDSAVSPLAALPEAHQRSNQLYVDRVGAFMKDIPQPLRDNRINQMSALCVHACADRHRAKIFGAPIASYALHVSSLLDGFVALLTAAPSEETLRALDRTQCRRPTVRALP